MFDSIDFELLKLNYQFSTKKDKVILVNFEEKLQLWKTFEIQNHIKCIHVEIKSSFFFNPVSCNLAFESDLSKSNSITWLDYKLHFPYWVFLWAVQKRLLTTHQEKYKKYFWKWKKGKKILPNQIFTTFHNQYIVIERNEIVFSLFKGELNKLWRLSFIMMVGFKISFVFALF